MNKQIPNNRRTYAEQCEWVARNINVLADSLFQESNDGFRKQDVISVFMTTCIALSIGEIGSASTIIGLREQIRAIEKAVKKNRVLN